jgi:hypothetical protein
MIRVWKDRYLYRKICETKFWTGWIQLIV